MRTDLVDYLKSYSKVVCCGQALSHCVNLTVRDLAGEWDKSRFKDLVVLKDASSSLTGFEKDGDKFLEDMQTMGVSLEKCASAGLALKVSSAIEE